MHCDPGASGSAGLTNGAKRLNLIDISDLNGTDIQEIWRLAQQPLPRIEGTVGWSFEGNGVRTRTTFIQAFRDLGLVHIELPNLLKGSERLDDLAGYLDPFYALYVIRESNHDQLRQFAQASRRPVINAMSQRGHPCEVLTDAYYIQTHIGPLEKQRICLWGPPSNVFRSWHQIAEVLGFRIWHACDPQYHVSDGAPAVAFVDTPMDQFDVVVTDSWSSQLPSPPDNKWSLSVELLRRIGEPVLLPTPPFYIGKEIDFDPNLYPKFAGYSQKALLLPMQCAIITHLASRVRESC
jgi:ornithine carbamoyltransferase